MCLVTLCVTVCTVRECVCATATLEASSPSPSPLTRPLRLSDQTRLSANATPASPLRFRLRFLSSRVVSCRRLRLALAAAATAAAAALVAAGQPQLANVAFRLNASIAGTCPTRTAVCIALRGSCVAARQRLQLRRSPTAAGEGEGGHSADSDANQCALKPERESKLLCECCLCCCQCQLCCCCCVCICCC